MRSSPIGPIPNLWKATYDIVAQVPLGRVTTYGEVAKALGDVVASRFVGLAMSMNDDIARVPCRRVVRSDGTLGGYTGGGPAKKAALLRSEGIGVVKGRVQDLDTLLFTDFKSAQPLKRLRQRQRDLRNRVVVPKARIEVQHVIGVDVAYDDDHAFAAAAIFEHSSGRMVDTVVVEGDAEFPYVPTYLAFRELPIVSSLVKGLPSDSVLMYDGNGLLHPEGMGIATHAGIVFGLPTIGLAKSLLCGSLRPPAGQRPASVMVRGKLVGYEVAGERSSRPVYVSVGHGISLAQSLDITRSYSVYRVPEPTRVAHMLAQAARREASQK
jgi:deoxyribonuclease V